MKSNIILVGMPGCGKTTIGKLMAEKLGYEFCDLDEYIVEKEKMSIDEMFKNGENYFRDIESSGVRDVAKMKNTVISTGGGVVKRQENIDALKIDGYIIFIDRPVENIISDVDTDSRPLLREGKDRLYKLLDERYKLYQNCCDIEIINDCEIDTLVEKIMGLIK